MLRLLSILALAAPPVLDLPPSAAPPVQPLGGSCAPEKLVRLVVRNISPGLAAADPRAQPQLIYRKGGAYLRTEGQPDLARNGAKAIFVVAEPDVWTIEISSRRGRHSVDPGPDYGVHAPILPLTGDVAPLFQGLEFGCEAAFVAAHAPRAQRTVAWGEATAALHVATVGDQSLAILMDERRSQPLLISYVRQGKPVWVVRYDEFRADLPDRPELFMPARGVTFEEGPPPGVRPPKPLDTPAKPPEPSAPP